MKLAALPGAAHRDNEIIHGGGFTGKVRRASKGAPSLTRLWTDEPTPAFCRGVEPVGRE